MSDLIAYPAACPPMPFSPWNIERPISPASSVSDAEDSLMTKRVQVFGGDAGDEAGDLCAPMLQVLLDLFDGVDYEDF